MEQTIAAIATPLGEGGISIIKISGEKSFAILKKIFLAFNVKNEFENRKLVFGYIKADDLVIDEVLVSKMKGPHTYTGEDVVEINCHGGILITQRILKLVLESGADLAGPGEFTQRAFLNGKKDINEVQTTLDILSAQSEESLDLAINSLNNSTENLVRELYDELMQIVTNVEVNIDYPEYDDINIIKNEEIKNAVDDFKIKIKKIITDSKRGEIIKNGIQTALVGKPNVGKSSLLNYLSREDKAIVTDIAGTTRDVVESQISLGRLRLNLLDTAGIRETEDIVEQIGVQKSLDVLNNAELVLLVTDVTEELSHQEQEIIEELTKNKKKFIILENKSDKVTSAGDDHQNNTVSLGPSVRMSATEELGEEELIQEIEELFDLKGFDALNTKHVNRIETLVNLEKVEKNMLNIGNLLEDDMYLDLISIDLKETLEILSDILGLNFKKDYLNEMFSRFCVGK